MSSTRSPKDLKQMIEASHGDMNAMQTNLAKLKALSEDDKTENALLRGRIDEQSQLIMILKQRADEAVVKVQALERINQELAEFRDSAEEEFRLQNKKYSMLDARFSDLAHNHEEMIKIKDEYKNRNKELMKENARLLEDNNHLFSKAIEERDLAILELEKKVRRLRDQCLKYDQQNGELKNLLKEMEGKYKSEVKHLRSKLAESDEKVKSVTNRLKHTAESKDEMNDEMQQRIQGLTKEKNDLLELAMSRGRLIQEKQVENKKLQQKVYQMEKIVREMEAKFEREAAAVNDNLQVRRLRTELEQTGERYDELVREYEAFKKHSSSLLKKEKELNQRLRHLMG